ncbi:MAG: hypothetical protein ACTS78_00255 [Arsenophonus sp. NC-WZS1-MAG3]
MKKQTIIKIKETFSLFPINIGVHLISYIGDNQSDDIDLCIKATYST